MPRPRWPRGFPARRPPQPRGRQRSPGEIRGRVGSGSQRCAGVGMCLYAVMYPIHCCGGVSSVAWSCCRSPRAFLTLPGLRQHPRTRPCASTGHGALQHDGTEMGEMLTMLLATTTPAVGLVRPSAEEEADRLQASRREPGLGLQLKSSHRQRAVTAERSAALTAAGACWNCCTRQ